MNVTKRTQHTSHNIFRYMHQSYYGWLIACNAVHQNICYISTHNYFCALHAHSNPSSLNIGWCIFTILSIFILYQVKCRFVFIVFLCLISFDYSRAAFLFGKTVNKIKVENYCRRPELRDSSPLPCHLYRF